MFRRSILPIRRHILRLLKHLLRPAVPGGPTQNAIITNENKQKKFIDAALRCVRLLATLKDFSSLF